MSKWIVVRTLIHSNYFKSVLQKVPLMNAEHMQKREAWCIVHRNSNFDNCDFYERKLISVLDLQMYLKKVGKIWTLSRNGAELLTRWYGVGWNEQVGLNSTCIWAQKYTHNQLLRNFGEGLLLFNIVTNDLPYVLQQDNARPHTVPIPVTISHRITWLYWNGMSLHGFKTKRKCLANHERLCKKILPENFRLESYNHGNVGRFWSDPFRQFGRQYAIAHRSVSIEWHGGLSGYSICAFWTVLYIFIYLVMILLQIDD